MTKLDKRDLEILNILKQNAKMTTQQISRKTWTPITTVHNRIKKMEKEGVIKGYKAIIDEKKIGNELTAIIVVGVNPKDVKKAIRMKQKIIRDDDRIRDVYEVTGSFEIDTIYKIVCKNMEELWDVLKKIRWNISSTRSSATLTVIMKRKEDGSFIEINNVDIKK